MTKSEESYAWKKVQEILMLSSPWVTLRAERWRDTQGALLDYWRVERADSVVVLPIYKDKILLPPPSFRPGVLKVTWDLPGGRIALRHCPRQAAASVLRRELNISPEDIQQITSLNEVPWEVDSSFSNQKLWGMTALISREADLTHGRVGREVRLTGADLNSLLEDLTCLQCRMVLREWLAQNKEIIC